MVGLGVCAVIISVFFLIVALSLWVSRKELAPGCPGYYARFTTFLLIGIVGAALAIYCFLPSPKSNSTNKDYHYKSQKDYSDGSDWDDYDYDGDGDINQSEWEDALGDYMDSIMP